MAQLEVLLFSGGIGALDVARQAREVVNVCTTRQ
jgi:hypothetical protein